MNSFVKVKNTYKEEAKRLYGSLPIQKIVRNDLTKEQYKSIVIELYHLFSQNPRLYITACSRLSSFQLVKFKSLFSEAFEQMSIDAKLKDDLENIGISIKEIPSPLTSTRALSAKSYYDIAYGRPVTVIGHLSIIGILAMFSEDILLQKFSKLGIEKEQMRALTFLSDNQARPFRIIRSLLNNNILEEDEIDEVCDSIRDYSSIFEDIISDTISRYN